MMGDAERVKEFLSEQRHMVVAVTNPDGQPWAIPVKIRDKSSTYLSWDSGVDTVHSLAITKNPRVALLLYSGKKDDQIGVYIEATIDKIDRIDEHYSRYNARINRLWLNDESYVKREVVLDS